MLDMSAAFGSDNSRIVTLRVPVGRWERGKWVVMAPLDRGITASIQPLGGREFRNLPEGLRNEARAVIYTPEAIKSDNEIIDGAMHYRVLSLDDWQDRGGYTKAILGELRPT